MATAAGADDGPLITGAMSSAEFREYSDDEIVSSSLFQFPGSRELLGLDAIDDDDQKVFLNPQELIATGPFPDSPSGSLPDSLSDSASSTKRTGTFTPSNMPDVTMDDDMNDDWSRHTTNQYADGDPTLPFAQESDSSTMDTFFGFDNRDDTFMEQAFDFNAASRGHEAVPSVPNEPNHNNGSQYSTTSPRGQKREATQELSPMSTMVASYDGSPAGALFNMPSPSGGQDWSSSAPIWPGQVASPPETLPSHMSFGTSASQPVHAQQQVPVFNNSSAFSFSGGYELKILPTPLKSRVETQIPIKMALNPLPPGITKLHLPTHTISKPKLMAKPPPERSPDTLELFVSLVCTSAMDQPALKQKALERAATLPRGYLPDLDDEENSPQNGGEVRICAGCITRERKRAARKKVKKPEEDRLWSQDEERRVVVFNTQEMKDWQPVSGILDTNGQPHPRAMQVDAPMRIACYCRHHNEKMGFNVIFTIKDWKDNVIAQAMSNPIMITDDHKTNPMTQLGQPAMSEAVSSSSLPMRHLQPTESNGVGMQAQQPGGASFAFSPPALPATGGQPAASYPASSAKSSPGATTTGLPGRSLSRPPSPSQGGPAKKRKSSASSRVPNGLTMTRMDLSPSMAPQSGASQQVSTVSSPFSPGSHTLPTPESIFGSMNPRIPFSGAANGAGSVNGINGINRSNGVTPIRRANSITGINGGASTTGSNSASSTNGVTTPNNTEQPPFFANRRSESMDNLAMAQLYSAPASNHPSRAPSPNGLRNGLTMSHQQLAQAIASNLYPMPVSVNPQRSLPIIHKIIPNEGPKIGGIEVTVLGASFLQGLEVWFGDNRATTTTFWGESSLVCLLPPSAVAGLVPVTIRHQGTTVMSDLSSVGKQPPVFKYIDDQEDKLIRTALSVLGHKMSGQMLDAGDFARRILRGSNSSWSNGSSSTGASGNGPMFGHAASNEAHLESQLLKVLDLIDLDDSAHRMRLDLTRSTGHTMLHLACSLGYHRFVAALLARGANPDARDNGGFTPLHMAAFYNHPDIARRLMLAGADPTMRSLSSLTAVDMARSRAVVRAIRTSQRHIRSRSGGSLHSRTSSAASLRSLWEPLTRAQTHEEPISVDSGEESPEYTTGDFEDEDPDENNYLRMRRPSSLTVDGDEVPEEANPDANNGVAAQTAALAAALKNQVQEQLQQFQQLAQQLQNLAHLPQIPQMPQMPQMPTFSGMQVLPDYQAYLQQAPFVRRVQQLMPGMSGNRADNQADSQADSSSPKVDGRWWDLSSYMNTVAAAPPAYEDIYPGEDMDKKIQSAARAAADAEADLKCSTRYDQQQQTSVVAAKASSAAESSSSTTTTTTKIPAVLEIGRKHAITKEQQENFLRARELKLKRISSDRNLFFIWIPLLLVMVCALLYSYFPALFPFIWTSVRAIVQAGQHAVQGPHALPGRDALFGHDAHALHGQ